MTAREMFESLGYKYGEESDERYNYKAIKYYDTNTEFVFSINAREFAVSYCKEPKYTTVDEFKAILKQMEELGWIAEKPETNFEHYKDEIIELYIEYLAISKGKMRQCCEILCSECGFADENGDCIGHRRIIEWLKKPYQKQTYKLTQFEYDLLNAYKNSGMRQCISNYGTLLEMYGKGHLKGIDTSTPIHEILDNCEVIK